MHAKRHVCEGVNVDPICTTHVQISKQCIISICLDNWTGVRVYLSESTVSATRCGSICVAISVAS
jgi:hypothetical protein